jgi:SOS-response transcriptional repressor LexA
MSRVHDIIRQALKREISKGKTQTELATLCQMSQGNIGKYLHSNPDAEVDTLKKFSVGLGIPLEALMISETVARYAVKPEVSRSPHVVPVINQAACGKWRDFSDLEYPAGHADHYETATTHDAQAFYVIAAGDSMIGSDISDGDLLLVEPHRTVQDGSIVLARNHDGCTVKKFFRHGDHIELRPMNEAHKSIFVKDDPSLHVYRISQIIKRV